MVFKGSLGYMHGLDLSGEETSALQLQVGQEVYSLAGSQPK